MNIKSYNFLQVGLGSMGKRRIRNLVTNGIIPKRIFGFDLSVARRKEAQEKYGIKTYADFKTAVKEVRPDVYMISTPPDKHHPYYLHAAKLKKHFFVEVGNHDTGFDKLYKLINNRFVAAPSCTFRYLPSVKKIKKIVEKKNIGKILSFQYHLGQYLPDWHPWEDYRKVYYAQKSTGGCKEMFPFELIWLSDIVNSYPKEVCGFTEKVSDLKMMADDIYASVVKFNNKVIGSITIDLLARKAFRTLRIIGSDGVLDWEWLDYRLKVYQAKTKKWKTINLIKVASEKGYNATEDMYNEEIKMFLRAIAGKQKYPFTFKEFHQILKSLYALEQGAKSKKTIIL